MKQSISQSIEEDLDILITSKPRPIWQKIVAAIFYTAVGVCIYIFFTTLIPNIIETASVLFVLALRFSLEKDYYFDLNDKRYKIVKRVGPVEIGKWKEFKDLDYVSVFKNGRGILEINLWYNKNRHFNLGQGENLTLALTAGKKIAKKLKIDLLDAASNPRDSKWVSVD